MAHRRNMRFIAKQKKREKELPKAYRAKASSETIQSFLTIESGGWYDC